MIFNKKMRAIDYNVLMSLLSLIDSRISTCITEYSGLLRANKIDVLPSYPRDLTKMNKPSIIIRKVETSQSKMSLDGFIGQYFDEDQSAYVDVHGIEHNMLIQFDTIADNNTQSSLLSSMISEDVINRISLFESGSICLYDYTYDKPTEIGTIRIIDDPMIGFYELNDSGNNDYINTIRVKLSIVQAVIPQQEFVDLSKWLKFHYTINSKTHIK